MPGTCAGSLTVTAIFVTGFAISTDETRYYLNGIYLHVADGDDGPVLRAVATDGHRLSRLQVLAPAGSAGMPGVIVPRKTVGELAKMAKEQGVSLEEMEKRFVAEHRPSSIIRRVATVEEVANMVVYVCSKEASATTGAALRVDGGVVATIA